jgi:hypothetical protein
MDPQGLAHVVHDQICEILDREFPADECANCCGYLDSTKVQYLLSGGVLPGITPIHCQVCNRTGVLVNLGGTWAIV